MNTPQACPNCLNPLPADAPAGLCPVCLLKTDPSAQPLAKGPFRESAETLTISPAAFARVRYFGDYELLEEIARGGMGVVWKARQASLNRDVAVKMILAGKLATEAELQRFRREAEAAANLQHPNIVAIHEVGEHDGQHYYSMDFVEGRDLGAIVRESGPFESSRAAECVKTIAEAVHFAHQRGTLHRDLKPQNVLLDAAGRPRVTDFGLAKFAGRDDSLTQTGATMGSPSYMPPEQAAGRLAEIGPASDVYALGAILYELITGRPPFRAETAVATMRQVMESEPVAPRKLGANVPPDLDTICLKCLEKNPARRYPSARALAEELGRFLNHQPIQAVRAGAVRKAESWLRGHPWTLVAAGSLMMMVLAGLLYWQHESLKFVESRPLGNQQRGEPGLLREEFKTWRAIGSLFFIVPLWAGVIFQRYSRGMTEWKDLFARPDAMGRVRPVSRRMRLVCGLIGVLGLALGTLYLAKIIQISVWDVAPSWSDWLSAYAGFAVSGTLLCSVALDYRRFVYGMPSQTLPAEEVESLRQSILDGDPVGAIRRYRRALPDAPLAEANGFVGKLSAELAVKYPEKFAPLKPWNLNWRAMGICLILGVVVFAWVWTSNPPASPAARLAELSAGFIICAGACFSLRLKARWGRWLYITFLVSVPLLTPFFQSPVYYFGGCVFGASMMVSGFTRKRRKTAPRI